MSWLFRSLLCYLVCLALPLLARADRPRELIREGNQHYAAGRYAEALADYERAGADEALPSAELLHNRAAAHFKLGQIDEARELWARVKQTKDAAFEARAQYNLGNCDYAEALAAAAQPQKARQALERLAQAADQYRDALRLDPALVDARANLELSQLLKRQIEERLQDRPQESQPTTRPQQDQQNQPETQPSQGDQQSEGRDQSDSSASTQSRPETQPSGEPESRPARPEEPQQNQDSQEQPDQEQPAEQPEPTSAGSQPAGADEDSDEPSPIHMTRAQAERLLQMVRDAEKARREMLARRRAAGQKPVARDW